MLTKAEKKPIKYGSAPANPLASTAIAHAANAAIRPDSFPTERVALNSVCFSPRSNQDVVLIKVIGAFVVSVLVVWVGDDGTLYRLEFDDVAVKLVSLAVITCSASSLE